MNWFKALIFAPVLAVGQVVPGNPSAFQPVSPDTLSDTSIISVQLPPYGGGAPIRMRRLTMENLSAFVKADSGGTITPDSVNARAGSFDHLYADTATVDSGSFRAINVETLIAQNLEIADTTTGLRDSIQKYAVEGLLDSLWVQGAVRAERVYTDSIIGPDSLIFRVGDGSIQEGGVDFDRFVWKLGGHNWELRSPLGPSGNFILGGGGKHLTHSGGGPSYGYFNVGIGRAVFDSATTIFDMTALGDSACTKATTAYSSTCVGWYAAGRNRTGYHITAVGRNACKYGDSSYNQTCLGQSSLREMREGNNNTAAGNESCQNTLVANNSVCMGNRAGFDVDTLNESVLMGREAGYGPANKVTSTVMIGDNIDFPLTADSTVTNYMSIANMIYSRGGLGTGLTPGVGRVSIGDSTDNGLDKFQVYGTARMDRLHLTGTASDTALKGTRLLVRSGSGTSTTPDVTIDELVVDAAGDGGITIATPSASRSALAFGSPDDGNGADIQWSYSNHLMTIGGRDPTAQVRFNAGNGTEVMRLTTTNTSIASFTGGTVVSAAATASYSSIRMPAGTAPTTCIAGGMWYDGTHFYGCTATGVAKQLDN